VKIERCFAVSTWVDESMKAFVEIEERELLAIQI
jgi:hypothetical protein